MEDHLRAAVENCLAGMRYEDLLCATRVFEELQAPERLNECEERTTEDHLF